jgi:hypothetical protein
MDSEKEVAEKIIIQPNSIKFTKFIGHPTINIHACFETGW